MRYTREVPIEYHRISDRQVAVYRGDMAPKPPLAPYMKMVELVPLLRHLSRTQKVIGYYTVPESEWVVSVPPLAESFGLRTVLGMANTKTLPSYARHIPSECLLLLSPNMYAVNYARTKKHVESLGGLMLPMGLECEEVVQGMQDFLAKQPLPRADTYIVPSGSGVALCGILRHLDNRARVHSVCTRPAESVRKVVDRHSDSSSVAFWYRDAKSGGEDSPFPTHRYWDLNAYRWMCENPSEIEGSLCFVNLGSGVQ
jgi:hypothetical protein